MSQSHTQESQEVSEKKGDASKLNEKLAVTLSPSKTTGQLNQTSSKKLKTQTYYITNKYANIVHMEFKAPASMDSSNPLNKPNKQSNKLATETNSILFQKKNFPKSKINSNFINLSNEFQDEAIAVPNSYSNSNCKQLPIIPGASIQSSKNNTQAMQQATSAQLNCSANENKSLSHINLAFQQPQQNQTIDPAELQARYKPNLKIPKPSTLYTTFWNDKSTHNSGTSQKGQSNTCYVCQSHDNNNSSTQFYQTNYSQQQKPSLLLKKNHCNKKAHHSYSLLCQPSGFDKFLMTIGGGGGPATAGTFHNVNKNIQKHSQQQGRVYSSPLVDEEEQLEMQRLRKNAKNNLYSQMQLSGYIGNYNGPQQDAQHHPAAVYNYPVNLEKIKNMGKSILSCIDETKILEQTLAEVQDGGANKQDQACCTCSNKTKPHHIYHQSVLHQSTANVSNTNLNSQDITASPKNYNSGANYYMYKNKSQSNLLEDDNNTKGTTILHPNNFSVNSSICQLHNLTGAAVFQSSSNIIKQNQMSSLKDLISERKEVMDVECWMKKMMEELGNQESQMDLKELFKCQQLVFSSGMAELIRQIKFQCRERGNLVERLWQSHMSIVNKAFTHFTDSITKLKKENISENQRAANQLAAKSEAGQTVQRDLQKRLSETELQLERCRLENKVKDVDIQKLNKACDHINFEKDLIYQQLEEVVKDYVQLRTELGSLTAQEVQLLKNKYLHFKKQNQLNTFCSTELKPEIQKKIDQQMQKKQQLQQQKLHQQQLQQQQLQLEDEQSPAQGEHLATTSNNNTDVSRQLQQQQTNLYSYSDDDDDDFLYLQQQEQPVIQHYIYFDKGTDTCDLLSFATQESQTDFVKTKCDKAVSCVKKTKERDQQTEIRTMNDKYLQTEIAIRKQMHAECQTEDSTSIGFISSPQLYIPLNQPENSSSAVLNTSVSMGKRKSIQVADKQNYLKGLYQQQQQQQQDQSKYQLFVSQSSLPYQDQQASQQSSRQQQQQQQQTSQSRPIVNLASSVSPQQQKRQLPSNQQEPDTPMRRASKRNKTMMQIAMFKQLSQQEQAFAGGGGGDEALGSSQAVYEQSYLKSPMIQVIDSGKSLTNASSHLLLKLYQEDDIDKEFKENLDEVAQDWIEKAKQNFKKNYELAMFLNSSTQNISNESLLKAKNLLQEGHVFWLNYVRFTVHKLLKDRITIMELQMQLADRKLENEDLLFRRAHEQVKLEQMQENYAQLNQFAHILIDQLQQIERAQFGGDLSQSQNIDIKPNNIQKEGLNLKAPGKLDLPNLVRRYSHLPMMQGIVHSISLSPGKQVQQQQQSNTGEGNSPLNSGRRSTKVMHVFDFNSPQENHDTVEKKFEQDRQQFLQLQQQGGAGTLRQQQQTAPNKRKKSQHSSEQQQQDEKNSARGIRSPAHQSSQHPTTIEKTKSGNTLSTLSGINQKQIQAQRRVSQIQNKKKLQDAIKMVQNRNLAINILKNLEEQQTASSSSVKAPGSLISSNTLTAKDKAQIQNQQRIYKELQNKVRTLSQHRANSRVQNPNILKNDLANLLHTIQSVYSDLFKQQQKQNEPNKLTLYELLLDHFVQQYGLQNVAESNIQKIVEKCFMLQDHSILVTTFCKLLGFQQNEAPRRSEDLNFYLKVVSTLDESGSFATFQHEKMFTSIKRLTESAVGLFEPIYLASTSGVKNANAAKEANQGGSPSHRTRRSSFRLQHSHSQRNINMNSSNRSNNGKSQIQFTDEILKQLHQRFFPEFPDYSIESQVSLVQNITLNIHEISDFLLSVYLEASYRLIKLYKPIFCCFADYAGIEGLSIRDFTFLARTFYKEDNFELQLLFVRESENIIDSTAEMGQEHFLAFCDRYAFFSEVEQTEFLSKIEDEAIFRGGVGGGSGGGGVGGGISNGDESNTQQLPQQQSSTTQTPTPLALDKLIEKLSLKNFKTKWETEKQNIKKQLFKCNGYSEAHKKLIERIDLAIASTTSTIQEEIPMKVVAFSYRLLKSSLILAMRTTAVANCLPISINSFSEKYYTFLLEKETKKRKEVLYRTEELKKVNMSVSLAKNRHTSMIVNLE